MKRKELLFELDGPGISPGNVDSLLLLRLAEAWFRLTVKVAESQGIPLKLNGLRIIDKCVAVAVVPNSQAAAKLAIRRTLRVVAGSDDAPKGADGTVRELRTEIRGLPPKQVAKVRVAGSKLQKVTTPTLPSAESPWELTELRVRPLRVGGQGRLTVELTSDSEIGPFTVEAPDLKTARALGSALHGDIDIEIYVLRDIDGHIATGRIARVLIVHEDDDATAWRKWFSENGSEWDDVDDVTGELGRQH